MLAYLDDKIIRWVTSEDSETGTLKDDVNSPAKVRDIAVDLVNAILKANGD